MMEGRTLFELVLVVAVLLSNYHAVRSFIEWTVDLVRGRKAAIVVAIALTPALAFAAPEPGNPELTWTNNGVYDGTAVFRAPVTGGKCSVATAGTEITKSLPGTATSYVDTAPLTGRACYCVKGFTLVDFNDGLGAVANYTDCSNADATKPKGPGTFREK